MDKLIQIADAALDDAYARAGTGSGHAPGQWMACRPGCFQCCIGVFPISAQDAQRLREGLRLTDTVTKQRVMQRAAESWSHLAPNFPGDASTGELFTQPHHEEAFEDFANDEPCPVLDPATGTCDLYAHRPLPCRTFGPPMPNEEGGLAVCELCFVGAPESEVARSAVNASFLELEAEETHRRQQHDGVRGPTLIAFALKEI